MPNTNNQHDILQVTDYHNRFLDGCTYFRGYSLAREKEWSRWSLLCNYCKYLHFGSIPGSSKNDFEIRSANAPGSKRRKAFWEHMLTNRCFPFSACLLLNTIMNENIFCRRTFEHCTLSLNFMRHPSKSNEGYTNSLTADKSNVEKDLIWRKKWGSEVRFR